MDTETQPLSEVVRVIGQWQSILVFIVFALANTAAIFPFRIPFPVPRALWNVITSICAKLRIIPPKHAAGSGESMESEQGKWKILRFHMSIIKAPLVGALFLLAATAIGRTEVVRGTLGADGTDPIDVMVFFITLAYIALSIDASGLLRFLAFRVLQKGGKHGHRLYLYLYMFFFSLTAVIGNDPIILSGTPFLAYMIRISRNIKNARAWIFAQFAMANTASAILVSSNPTNLVVAGAFGIRFIDFTANLIVPVLFTTLIMFPCLLYVVFRDEQLIPKVIDMYQVDEEEKRHRKPVNPNLAVAEVDKGEDEAEAMMWEIINPWINKPHAIVSATIMVSTLISVLIINAVTSNIGQHVPVYWVTCSGAALMFTYDAVTGWLTRHQSRETARAARLQVERTRLEREYSHELDVQEKQPMRDAERFGVDNASLSSGTRHGSDSVTPPRRSSNKDGADAEKQGVLPADAPLQRHEEGGGERQAQVASKVETELRRRQDIKANTPKNLVSMATDAKLWLHDTFPTTISVLSKLPFPLLPFAFAMFVLVEALVSKGWVDLFARGWDDWVNKTGTMGAIAGGGFLSVVLSNCTGTNIGTAILLCRIVQAWQVIHNGAESIITDRTFWGAVYSMAIGLNYGAYSSTFCASLAGLLWKDILEKKGVIVGRLEFFRVNLPIIAIGMGVGCAVLAGEIYIFRSESEVQLNLSGGSH